MNGWMTKETFLIMIVLQYSNSLPSYKVLSVAFILILILFDAGSILGKSFDIGFTQKVSVHGGLQLEQW